jgi:hypothetical protein
MAEIGVRLGGDNSAFRGMLDESEAALGKFGRSIGTLLPAISAAAVAGFFKQIMNEAGVLQDLSDRLSVSTDSLQAFNFAVTQAGGKTEDASKAWDKARLSIDELVGGSDTMAKNFEKLNLTSRDFIGLNLAQSFEKIAQAYRDNKDAAGSYEAIAAILGTKTLPKVMLGLEELADKGFPGLEASARSAMQFIDKDAISSLDKLGDTMAALWSGFKAQSSNAANFALDVLANFGTVAGVIWDRINGGNLTPAEAARKAAPAMRAVTDELQLAMVAAEKQKKLDEDAAKKRATKDVSKEEFEKAARKLKAKEDAEAATQADKIALKASKDRAELRNHEVELVKLAKERAKAQGAVTSEFTKQLSEIQKMAGAGQGGFQATSTGGKEGTTTVAALENAVANAKKAVEVAYKSVDRNEADSARNLVDAKALLDQSERNLLKAQSQQGIGSPVEILISGLDFTSLSKTSDAAFGSREKNSFDAEMLKIAKENKLSTQDIKRAVKVIEGTLLGD